MRQFMERYEFFVLPAAQVPPFDVDQPYVTEIDGVAMETYIDWMKSCYYISIVGNPAISVPCGFTPEGLPVGLQIVGAASGRLGPAADRARVRAGSGTIAYRLSRPLVAEAETLVAATLAVVIGCVEPS